MLLEKYSFGIGDRFAHQASAQLRAFEMIAKDGVEVTPVWNKSNREHTFIGSEPASVLAAARKAQRIHLVADLSQPSDWLGSRDSVSQQALQRLTLARRDKSF